ncbi:MAG: acyltransferase, partial [Actinomycetota bacterium]|nr:acyltransferase [Actinomycetota bacterium]
MRRWRRRRLALFIALAGAAGSAVLMAALYQPAVDPSRVYYGTDTRAAGLLFGAALAFVWVPGQPRRWAGRARPLLLDIAGLAALGALVWFYLRLDQYQPFLFQGGFALVALATVVVILVAVHPHTYLGPHFLGWRPLRWIGLRSYSIYLWHWPVFMLTRPELDVPIDGWPLLALRLVATIVLADLSYRFVETPIRTGALGRAWKSLREAQGARRWRLGVRWAAVLGMGTALSVALGVAVVHAQPPPPPSYLAVESIHTDAPTTPTSDAEGSTPAPQMSDTDAAALTTPPDTADSETAQPKAAEEDGKTTSSNPLVADRVTFIGDSVMIGAYGELKRALGEPAMYADVGMQAAGVIEIVQKHRAAGDLGDTVVIHIGSNGVFNEEQFDETMQMLKDARKVVVVNVKAPRPWEQPNNEMLAEGVQRYPNAVLLDWHAASAGRPELFVEDGIHLQPEGQRLYADMIAAQLPDDVRSGAS